MSQPFQGNIAPGALAAWAYLETAYDEGLNAAVDEIEGIGELCADVNPDYRDGLILIPAADARFRKKQGGLRPTFTPTVGEQAVTVDPESFEILIEKYAAEDGKYDAQIIAAKQIGMRVRTRRTDLLRGDPLVGAPGILGGKVVIWGPDGKTYYAEDHLVDWEDPGGDVWPNYFPGKPLTRPNFQFVRAKLFNAPDQSGRPRASKVTHFCVGSDQVSQAKEIVAIQTVASGGGNPDYDPMIKVVTVPEFKNGEWQLNSSYPEAKETPFGYWLRTAFQLVYKGLQEDAKHENHRWIVEGRDGIAFRHPWRSMLAEP